MGPGLQSLKTSVFDRLYFSPTGDPHEWQRHVGEWVNLIKSASENGSQRRLNTVYKILGQVLYREGLRSEQQKLVNESQKEKKINHPQTHDTVKSALDVVKAVSVD